MNLQHLFNTMSINKHIFPLTKTFDKIYYMHAIFLQKLETKNTTQLSQFFLSRDPAKAIPYWCSLYKLNLFLLDSSISSKLFCLEVQ
jgi:hypothetical protein